MEKTILTSIVIISLIFILLLIGVFLLLYNFYKSREKQNKEMYSSILLAEEKERERISRDIHDELGGLITSTRLTLGSLNTSILDEDVKTKVNHITEVLEIASAAARNITLELSPEALHKFGLKGALKTLSSLYSSFYGIIEIRCTDSKLNSHIEIGIYRMINEILNNAIKYSDSKYIYVNVFIDEEDALNIKAGDNGKGFDLNLVSIESNGIKNIRNRCKMLNGKFHMTTSIGNGCHYHLTFNKSDYVEI